MRACEEIRRQLEAAGRQLQVDLVATASQLLSSITQLAGVVTLPRAQAASITQIEFVALSENRVLVVLVLDDREVQNRIIQLERHYSAEELRARRQLPQRAVPRPLAARRCARRSCGSSARRTST